MKVKFHCVCFTEMQQIKIRDKCDQEYQVLNQGIGTTGMSETQYKEK